MAIHGGTFQGYKQASGTDMARINLNIRNVNVSIP
jgi:hypothetical protein